MNNNDKYKNAGGEAMLSGDFGEGFVAYLLAKKGILVTRASTVGLDLFAKDPKGSILQKNKISGISVKARISKRSKRYVPSVTLRSARTLYGAKQWGIKPYLAIVVGSLNNRLDVFLVPFEDIKKLKGNTKRKDVIAVSQLYKNVGKKVIKLF